jgi:crotonobetainyl-CoA:carnitine CoA-transferase CaiB-like acyl-CoA transferase
VRPDIIYISLKGLGSTGPYAKHVTWGPNLLCLFGMTHLWNHPDAEVSTAEARVQHPDFMAGVAGASAVMAALLHRSKTGQGQFIDSAQIEVGANFLGPAYVDYTVNGRSGAPEGNRRAGAGPYGAYPCSDGSERWCAISVKSQPEWERFRVAIGDPAWCREPRFATPAKREQHRAELDELVGAWTRQHTGLEVMERLQAAGVAAAPIQDVEDQLYRDPNYRERGFFVSVAEPVAGEVIAEHPPVHSSEGEVSVRTPAPLMGEHTDQVLRDVLHLDDRELARLQSESVLD